MAGRFSRLTATTLPIFRKKLAASQGEYYPTDHYHRSYAYCKKAHPPRKGTAESHGAPLGEEEIVGLKEALGLPTDEKFYVPADLQNLPELMKQRGEQYEADWNKLFESWSKEYPQLRKEWDEATSQILPDLSEVLTMFGPDAKMASRASSGQVLNAYCQIGAQFGGWLSLTCRPPITAG